VDYLNGMDYGYITS